MTDRRQATEAVFVAVLNDDKVLLQRRQNTGWMDGWYDLPSGHVEDGESIPRAAVREVVEETGLEVLESDLGLFHVAQSEEGVGAYVYFMFRTKSWRGEPRIGDLDKVSEVRFCPLDSLPEKTAPYVRRALADIATKEVTFAHFNVDGHEVKNT